MKRHFLGFIALLITWSVGSAILGIVFGAIFGDLLERYTGLIGFLLGIYFWYLIARKKKPTGPSMKVTADLKE